MSTDRPKLSASLRNAIRNTEIGIGLRFKVGEDAADPLDGNVIGAGQRGYCEIAPGLGRQHAPRGEIARIARHDDFLDAELAAESRGMHGAATASGD